MDVNPARALAVNLGKGARWLSRHLGAGGGTALPGLLAARINPDLLPSLAAAIPQSSLLITGTNGKTTTTRMAAQALRDAGLMPITNREGSNLLRGLATALLDHTDGWGNLRAPKDAIGVFEVDEGTLPPAVQALRPRALVLTNLFRDQLDRYFEVDYVARLWEQALSHLPSTASLVLNADDPQVAYQGAGSNNPVVYYGLEDASHAQPRLEHAADFRRCPACQAELVYSAAFYAHLGHYGCPACGWGRPRPQVVARRVELLALEGSRVELETPDGFEQLELPLPGLYNVYNALAAIAAAYAVGVDVRVAAAAVSGARAAFGRLERFRVGDKSVCIILVKNPSGLNQVLRLLSPPRRARGLVLALNDNIADGRDVSWIWDVDLEMCRGRLGFVVAAGERAYDMALRLKYAGVGEGEGASALLTVPDIFPAFKEGLARTAPGETLYILPTYTALLELRQALSRAGMLEPYWER